MKATLEFDLPEESDMHRDALMGPTYLALLQDFDNELRNAAKYHDDSAAAKWRDKLNTMALDLEVILWR